MAITTIENIEFKIFPKQNTYSCYAKHGSYSAGVLQAVLDLSSESTERVVSLDKIQVLVDYRRIGIAEKMINGLVVWSKEREANSINGYILNSLLLKDSPDHVADYLSKLGFILNGNDFQMDL